MDGDTGWGMDCEVKEVQEWDSLLAVHLIMERQQIQGRGSKDEELSTWIRTGIREIWRDGEEETALSSGSWIC